MGLEKVRLIEFPVVHNAKGNLTFMESERLIPFEIKRVYYLHDVPGGAERGGHAHKDLEQVLIAVSGSFDVILDAGRGKHRYHLNRSHFGLYVPTMIWREIDNFSGNSVCLVLASQYYDEQDYYREYGEYQAALSGPKP